MRIGLICDEYPPRTHGGIGTFVSGLAQGLSARGHAVRVYEMGDSDASRRDGAVELRTIRRSPIPKLGAILDRLRLRARLNADFAAGEIELVETPDFAGPLPLGLDRRCPVLVRLHGSLKIISAAAGLPSPPILSLLEGLTLRANGDWVGVSRHAIELARRGFPSARPGATSVLFPPVDVSGAAEGGGPVVDEAGRALPPRFLLHAGTVSAIKGVFLLAEAARQVLAYDPNLHLVFAGRVVDGPHGDTRTRIRGILGSDLAARCWFAGHRPRSETLALIGRALVFVSASPFETFGLSVAEAMALGRPVVAPNHPPFDEWIEPERTGLLAEPSDPDALAGVLTRLLDNEALRDRLGRAAQAAVQRYLSPEFFLDRTIELYQSRLSQARVAART